MHQIKNIKKINKNLHRATKYINEPHTILKKCIAVTNIYDCLSCIKKVHLSKKGFKKNIYDCLSCIKKVHFSKKGFKKNRPCINFSTNLIIKEIGREFGRELGKVNQGSLSLSISTLMIQKKISVNQI
jgi:hypothetical protein